MILIGFNSGDVILGMLWVSIIGFAIYIGYKRLLRHLSKDAVKHEEYFNLEAIEINPASGEIPFYFTSNEIKPYTFSILDAQMNELQELKSGECMKGGNIIRFDSSKLSNGDYFYCLKTSNQKTVKKMSILNS
tara:strand:- start:159 stop:557 length:399 start_codon:yes stop_codon:yes gene_type:complete